MMVSHKHKRKETILMEHTIQDKVDGKPYTCECGLSFKTITEASDHTPVFMNTPNAAKLLEAIKIPREN